MGEFAKYDLPKQVVIFSTADWDAPLWTNKQQIASRLASDFQVIYVEPLAALGSSKRSFSKRSWTDPSGVHIVRPAGALPFGNKLWYVNKTNCSIVATMVMEAMKEQGFSRPILWLYPPTSRPFLEHIHYDLSCYDCVDDYSAFPGTWITTTKNMEKQLLQSVDAVFTTARSLFEKKKRHNKHTYFVPNVADFKHFNQAVNAKPPHTLREMPKPVIGFVGALNYKIDNELVSAMLAQRPEWSFVFVGPDRGMGVHHFFGHRNAYFLGRKDPQELPSIMAGFDVCFIPYVIDRYTQGVLPLKFFEYLATGKPVVTTNLNELGRYRGMIDIASGAEGMIEAIEKRLDNDPDREKRIEIATNNSWEHRINKILHHLEEVYHDKREHLL